jgi:hypothetical protein
MKANINIYINNNKKNKDVSQGARNIVCPCIYNLF